MTSHGHATGGDGSFVVAGETLADMIAEFERASERSRVIAADFELDDTTGLTPFRPGRCRRRGSYRG
jgi:hypothetical protein